MSEHYNAEIEKSFKLLTAIADKAGISYKSLLNLKTMTFEDVEKHITHSRKANLLHQEGDDFMIFKHGEDFSVYGKTEKNWLHAFTTKHFII